MGAKIFTWTRRAPAAPRLVALALLLTSAACDQQEQGFLSAGPCATVGQRECASGDFVIECMALVGQSPEWLAVRDCKPGTCIAGGCSGDPTPPKDDGFAPGTDAGSVAPGETDTGGGTSLPPDTGGATAPDAADVDTTVPIVPPPGTCGDGITDEDEVCDDGNNVDGDACSSDCQEAFGELLPDLYGGSGPAGRAEINVAFSECNKEGTAKAYKPGGTLTVKVCAMVLKRSGGPGISVAKAKSEIANADAFFAAAGAKVTLSLIDTESMIVDDALAAPVGSAEMDAVFEHMRDHFAVKHPNECNVVMGYVESADGIDDYGDPYSIGGLGSWPSEGIHAAFVTKNNVDNGDGESTAHELGHVFGLYHTFETGGDECSDTPYDDICGCIDDKFSTSCHEQGCDVDCPDGNPAPTAENVMSYFHCDEPLSTSFSSCQINRMRCFVSKMFEGGDTYPLPTLLSPANGQHLIAGSAVAFSWTLGLEGADHSLRIRHEPSNDLQTFDMGTLTSKTVKLWDTGQYHWTVEYQHDLCPDNSCSGEVSYFTIDPESLSCPESCSGHGACDYQSGKCTCDTGFTGSACDKCASGYSSYPTCYKVKTCPGGGTCSGHGSCNDQTGVCSCNSGYSGSSCNTCQSGYSGYPDCKPQKSCPGSGNCSGHGTCNGSTGVCSCNTGYSGSGCSSCAAGYKGYPSCYPTTSCPGGGNCSGHGSCDDSSGKCSCYSGYSGTGCDTCAYGYTGYPSCYEKLSCGGGGTCNGHGSCNDQTGACSCYTGYSGSSCSACASGYTGYPSCYKSQSCPSGCSGNGSCNDQTGTCLCYMGYSGSSCSSCASGYTGYPSCYETQSCPSGCSGNGSCNDQTGSCSCYTGYSGSGCSSCASGYTGYPDCSKTQTCPGGGDCNGNGSCNSQTGNCSCYTGYSGSSCSACASGYSGYPDCKKCGNGTCESGETPSSCPSDCGNLLSEYKPSVYYGNTGKSASLSCTSGSSGWHKGTSGSYPYWVFASNCGVPSVSSPTSYSGYNARWTFQVKAAGNYKLSAWVPDSNNACGFGSDKLSGQVHYILDRAGQSNVKVDPSQAANMGSALVLWNTVYLEPGSHTLYLYDDAGGGCACNGSGCGTTSTRVFADTVYVKFVN